MTTSISSEAQKRHCQKDSELSSNIPCFKNRGRSSKYIFISHNNRNGDKKNFIYLIAKWTDGKTVLYRVALLLKSYIISQCSITAACFHI